MSFFRRVRLPTPLRSLRAQLLLWVALPVTIGIFALSLTELHSHEQAMQTLVQERADNLARSAAALIAMRLDDEKDRLLQAAGQTRLHHEQSEDWSSVLDELAVSFPAGTALFAADGQILARTAQSDWADRQATVDLVQRTLSVQAAIAEMYGEGAPATLLLAVPVKDGSTERVLMAAIPISSLALTDTLTPLALHPQAVLTVYSSTGLPLTQLGDAPIPSGSKVVFSQASIPLSGWQLVFQESWEGMVPPLLRFENLLFIVVAMAIVVSLLSAWFGLRNIVQPLQRLDAAASRVGWGDFNAVQEPVGGVQEIEDLRIALAGMADQLRSHQQELQGYIGAMTLGQEEERKRVARDLHDDTVQALIALNQQAELIERRVASDPTDAVNRLRGLRPLINQTIADLRRQIHDLRPLYLEDLGFVPAMEMLIRQVCERSGLIGDFECTGEPQRRLPTAVEISGFRIAQEALRNVATHAQASWVHVELVFEPTGITLRVEDDGVGFQTPGHPFHLAEAGHYGLLGMRERAELHGGWLRVESEPGRGTTVTAWLSLPPAAFITDEASALSL